MCVCVSEGSDTFQLSVRDFEISRFQERFRDLALARWSCDLQITCMRYAHAHEYTVRLSIVGRQSVGAAPAQTYGKQGSKFGFQISDFCKIS